MSIFRKKMVLGACLFAGLVAAMGAAMVYKNGLGEAGAASSNSTLFQGFEWNITSNGMHWDNLADKADELSEVGVTAMWLPPAFKASRVSDAGYSVYDIYDLGEFNQKGTVRTKYGTKDQYLSLIDTLHSNDIQVYADIVLNHKSSSDATEVVNAVQVNGTDRNEVVSEPVDIEAWTVFNFEGRNNAYSSFKWNASHFDGVDWDQLSGTNNIYRFADKSWESDVSTENGNYDYLLSADIDLDNPEVVNELNTWAKWYVETANLDGFRLDAVKHMSASFYKNWLKNIRLEEGNNLFSVAEYYDYNVDTLKKYLTDTGNSTKLFDFPLQSKFYQASTGEFDMSTLYTNTLTATKPNYSVPFVENHDTQASQNVKAIKQWFKGQAYTAILTRAEGTPCVFYGDYYGTGDGSNKAMSSELNVLMAARKIAAYGKQRNYFNDADVVGWTREGNYYHNYYGLAALITDGAAGTKTMNVGTRHKNETWIDITGNCSNTVTIDKKGNGIFSVNEKSYSVWVSQKAAAEITSVLDSVNSKSEFIPPEDNTITIFYNTTWAKSYFHHKIGSGEWTSTPGEKMSNTNLNDYKVITLDLGTSQFVTGCFNDGANDWDSNGNSNYTLSAGTYTISSGNILMGTPTGYDPDASIIEEPVEEDKEELVDDAKLSLIYYSTWSTPYAHYGVGSRGWTTSPGNALKATEKDNFYSIDIAMNSKETVTLCFNDGDSNWDSNGGSNYIFNPGSYIICNGQIYEGTIDDFDTIFGTGDEKTATVYYYADSKWASTVYAHYGIGDTWTTAPGVEMILDDADNNVYKITIDMGSALFATMCFNDNNNWDSNNGSNYTVRYGTSTIKNGVVTAN